MVKEIKVLDHGFVRLDGALADDLSVVNSARVSFNTRHETMEEGDDKLIKFLMKHKHGTPFEHNLFRFHVKCPLFVAREWQRHRIGSYNEMSGRYTKMEPEFYIPEKFRKQVGKPGAYQFEEWTPSDLPEAYQRFTKNLIPGEGFEAIATHAWAVYETLLSYGIAKEMARMILPLNLYTQYYFSCNARSLMNFLSLRNSEQAQWEICQYAKALEVLFKQAMPITAQCFIDNGRVAP